MQLTENDKRICAQRGIYVKDACDKCGALIHYMNRFTRFGEKGVWCSRECRDGKLAVNPGACKGCGQSLTGKRKGSLYCSNTCRMRNANQ